MGPEIGLRKPDTAEVLRYMGVRGARAMSGGAAGSGQSADEPDAAAEIARIAHDAAVELAESCVEELMGCVTPREVHREFPLAIREDCCDFHCFSVLSRRLSSYLSGCTRVILLAATIGEGADFLLRRYAKFDVARAAAMQAAGAAVLETYLDDLCDSFRDAYAGDGWHLTGRFSPGYGDFPLSVQPLMADVLKMEKHAGIALTDSLLMLPTKSVTAVIGMSRSDACESRGGGCDCCDRTDCMYSADDRGGISK